MKNRTVFSKKKSGQPKVAIQLCHLEEEGGDPVHQLAG